MGHIAKFFIENFKLTIVLSTFLVMMGYLGIKTMNAESYPAVDFATATITTYYKGAAPEDIEALITKPIEDEIRTVSGLKDVRSISQTGQSTITVRIDMDNVDVDKVMDDLQKAVQRVSDLPEDLEKRPDFREINSQEFPAIEIAVIGTNESRKRDKVADILKDIIEDNSSVKDVRLSGFREREFTINLLPNKLDELHISATEVLGKVASRNISSPGGDISNSQDQQLVRLEAKAKSKEELDELVVRSNFEGQVVKLKDIAEVVDGEVEAKTLTTHNGEASTLMVVNKKAGADTIKLADDVAAIIARYQKLYEGDLKFKIYNNEANKVRAKLDVLTSNAITGLVLVIFFLLIFMPGWVGVVASLSLPLAILSTLGVMPYFGMNLDSITILALIIAIGMLVDNSIVITDNFVELRKQGIEKKDALIKTISSLSGPITATAFTTIAAFLPMLVTKGIMGRFIRFIPIVVTISLLFSLVESFFLLPMRLNIVGNTIKNDDGVKKDWFAGFRDRFEGFMHAVVSHRYIAAALCMSLIIGSLALMALGNKFMLFPPEQTEVYLARVEAPKGTPVEETIKMVEELSYEINKAAPDYVRETVGRAGTSKMGPTDSKGGEGDNQGLIIIYANDYAKYNVNYNDFLAKLRVIETSQYGDVTFEERVNGPPVGAPITVTFRSNSYASINSVIDYLVGELSKVDGIFDLKTDDVVDADDVFVNVNYELADRLGVSVTDIGTTVRTALSGTFTSEVTLNNKEVKYNVRFTGDSEDKLAFLSSIKVNDKRGNLVPLGKIATFENKAGTPQIKRYDFKRAKTLLGNVDDTKITSGKANALVARLFNKEKKRFPDVAMVFGGQAESTNESMQSLKQASILAAIGIFALLVFMFKSFLRPFIIMLTIPLGFVGFSVAFFLHQRPISFLALVGIIGLAGIIVNSGIVLIDFIESMRKEGKHDLHDILVKASGMRLRAVVTTSLTTVSGLFPTAYGIGGADSMLIPMTMAMAWGLTTGTLLTLVFIPPAYAIIEDWVAFCWRVIWWIPFFRKYRPTNKEVNQTGVGTEELSV